MNVTVSLYQNFSDPFVVHKNKTLVKTCTCQITKNVDVDELDLELDMDSGINTCNYAYIDTFSRFYFLTPGVINGNQMVMHAVSDPLSSFWNSYSASNCIAERSTSNPNSDLVDELLPFKPQPKYVRRKMSTGFEPSSTGGCYILTVGGK